MRAEEGSVKVTLPFTLGPLHIGDPATPFITEGSSEQRHLRNLTPGGRKLALTNSETAELLQLGTLIQEESKIGESQVSLIRAWSNDLYFLLIQAD
jgi:hypothetical protein